MLTIACVLRSGGIFNPQWVQRLQRNVARHAPEHEFVCLSDRSINGVKAITLAHNWPRWWPIIEVFRPGLFKGRVIYFDLANMIVGDISPLAEGVGFIIAADPAIPGPQRYCSGVMAFDADDNEIYEKFDPASIKRLRGDQDWIAELRPQAQNFKEGLVVSYKAQCKSIGEPTPGASVVLFHGIPKPPQADPWVQERWNADWQ